MSLYSDCCGAADRVMKSGMKFSETDICPKCGEHTEFIEYKKWNDSEYIIGSDGSVWRLNFRKSGKKRKHTQYTNRGGYKCVYFCFNGKPCTMLVHRLVAISFIPNPESKPQVNHINGIKSDNRVENLEWSTVSENILHSFRVIGRKFSPELRAEIKRRNSGENSGMAKITNADALEIRRLSKSGVSAKQLAQKFNISRCSIYSIRNHKAYNNVSFENDELIEELKQLNGKDLISVTIKKAIADKASHTEIFDYIKSQANDNLRIMADVLGIELTEKILAV